MVIISLMDVNRQWFKARVGVDVTETPRDIAFCAYTILEETPRVMVIPDAQLDPRFCNNPLVVGPPYIRFYAGASIILDGLKIATLCLIDVVPRDDFTTADQQMLIDIADTISDMMTVRRRQKLEERFNGVFMHQSILTVMQDPLTRVQAAYNDLDLLFSSMKHQPTKQQSIDELQRKVTRFQSEVDGFSHFLDDAVRVLARVTLASDSVAPKERENANKAVVSCDLDMVHQSLRAALREVNITCPCRNSIPSLKEKLSTHADLLLVCFVAWLHAFAAQEEEGHGGYRSSHRSVGGIAAVTLALTTCPDHLGVMIVLHDDLIMQARMVQACQAISTMLAWVGGRFVVSADDGLVQLLVPFICQDESSNANNAKTPTYHNIRPAALIMNQKNDEVRPTSNNTSTLAATVPCSPMNNNQAFFGSNNHISTPTRRQEFLHSQSRSINRSSVEREAIQNYLQSMWDNVRVRSPKVLPLE